MKQNLKSIISGLILFFTIFCVSAQTSGLDANKPTSGLTVGQKYYATDSQIWYDAVSTTEWMSVGCTHRLNMQDVWGLNTALAGVDQIATKEESLTVTAGTASTSVINSNTSGSTPVTITAGTNVTISETGNNITLSASGGSSYRTLVTLGSDVINNNAVANTLQDVTGLSFSVTSGTTYRFYCIIPYSSAATTTGSRWTINAPASTLLAYTSTYTLTATTQTLNFAGAVAIPAASNLTSLLTGNMCIIQGVIKPSANGTLQIRFASEVSNSAITAKAGATLEWW